MRRRKRQAKRASDPLDAAFERFILDQGGGLDSIVDRHGITQEQVAAVAMKASVASLIGSAVAERSGAETVATAFLFGLGVGTELERG